MADLEKKDNQENEEKKVGTARKIGRIFFDGKNYASIIRYVFDVKRPARMIKKGWKIMTTNTVKSHGTPIQFIPDDDRKIIGMRMRIAGFSFIFTGIFVAAFCLMSAAHNIVWAWVAPFSLAAFIWMATMKFWQSSIVLSGKKKSLSEFLLGK